MDIYVIAVDNKNGEPSLVYWRNTYIEGLAF